jgi:hypothetical protein
LACPHFGLALAAVPDTDFAKAKRSLQKPEMLNYKASKSTSRHPVGATRKDSSEWERYEARQKKPK